MSTTTNNYGLVKPQLTDSADITAMNGNWDKIDTELKKRATLGNDGKIPSDLLPNQSQVFAVSITEKNEDTFVANKTFAEIAEAYNAGKTVVASYLEYKCQLTSVDVTTHFGFAASTDSGNIMIVILSDNFVGVGFNAFAQVQHRHSMNDIIGLEASLLQNATVE